MTIEIDPKLLGVIHAALKSIPDRKLDIPVAAMFRFGAEGGRLHVTASDFDLEATLGVDCAAEFEPVCLPPYLVEAGAGLGATKIAIEIGDHEVVVSAGRSRFRGPVLPGGDFPRLTPKFDGGGDIAGDALARILDATVDAVSTGGDNRFYLEGVFLEVAEDRLVATATDGHRLHNASIEGAGFRLPHGIIVPTKAVGEIVRVAGKAGKNAVRVETGDTGIAIVAGDERIVSKLIDGAYPDWRRVMPKPSGTSATFDIPEMLAALDRVGKIQAESTATGKGKKSGRGGSGVRIKADGEWLTVTGSGDATEAVDAVRTEFAGEWGTHGVAGKYLRATLAAMKDRGSDTAMIDIGGPGAPMRIESTTDEDFTAVVMPMRI